MNSAFSTTAFWIPYLTLELDDVSKEDAEAQLNILRNEYAVRDETTYFEYGGRQMTSIRRVIEFPFPCGERYSLVIEHEPSDFGCTRNLFLVDSKSGVRSAMGWWDQARWHPYCLRPEEFDLLLQYWNRSDRRYGPNVAFLLFCQFVGLADTTARDALVTRAKAAADALGLSASGGKFEIPLQTPGEDYRWEVDADLGWVFTSDKYCCYSLRNRPHAESDEGRVPFTAFQEMMSEVQRRLGSP